MFKRKCPQCERDLFYKKEVSLKVASKKNTKCKKCTFNDPKIKAKMVRNGKTNGMHGKTVYQVWVEKYGIEEANIRKAKRSKKLRDAYKNLPQEKKDEIKEKTTHYGKENGMYGKNVFDIWIQKYGKVESQKRIEEFKKNNSFFNTKGKNNPMYGKPSPQGSGNGWSGWYKGWYFRSLKELSYMIKVIERFNLNWEDGERVSIKYFCDGEERTYRPDFILEDKYMIEVKPKKLWNSKIVLLKSKAGKEYCSNNNLYFKLRDIAPLKLDLIKTLHENDEINFINRYEEKFLRLIKDKG